MDIRLIYFVKSLLKQVLVVIAIFAIGFMSLDALAKKEKTHSQKSSRQHVKKVKKVKVKVKKPHAPKVRIVKTKVNKASSKVSKQNEEKAKKEARAALKKEEQTRKKQEKEAHAALKKEEQTRKKQEKKARLAEKPHKKSKNASKKEAENASRKEAENASKKEVENASKKEAVNASRKEAVNLEANISDRFAFIESQRPMMSPAIHPIHKIPLFFRSYAKDNPTTAKRRADVIQTVYQQLQKSLVPFDNNILDNAIKDALWKDAFERTLIKLQKTDRDGSLQDKIASPAQNLFVARYHGSGQAQQEAYRILFDETLQTIKSSSSSHQVLEACLVNTHTYLEALDQLRRHGFPNASFQDVKASYPLLNQASLPTIMLAYRYFTVMKQAQSQRGLDLESLKIAFVTLMSYPQVKSTSTWHENPDLFIQTELIPLVNHLAAHRKDEPEVSVHNYMELTLQRTSRAFWQKISRDREQKVSAQEAFLRSEISDSTKYLLYSTLDGSGYHQTPTQHGLSEDFNAVQALLNTLQRQADARGGLRFNYKQICGWDPYSGYTRGFDQYLPTPLESQPNDIKLAIIHLAQALDIAAQRNDPVARDFSIQQVIDTLLKFRSVLESDQDSKLRQRFLRLYNLLTVGKHALDPHPQRAKELFACLIAQNAPERCQDGIEEFIRNAERDYLFHVPQEDNLGLAFFQLLSRLKDAHLNSHIPSLPAKTMYNGSEYNTDIYFTYNTSGGFFARQVPIAIPSYEVDTEALSLLNQRLRLGLGLSVSFSIPKNVNILSGTSCSLEDIFDPLSVIRRLFMGGRINYEYGVSIDEGERYGFNWGRSGTSTFMKTGDKSTDIPAFTPEKFIKMAHQTWVDGTISNDLLQRFIANDATLFTAQRRIREGLEQENKYFKCVTASEEDAHLPEAQQAEIRLRLKAAGTTDRVFRRLLVRYGYLNDESEPE